MNEGTTEPKRLGVEKSPKTFLSQITGSHKIAQGEIDLSWRLKLYLIRLKLT